MLLIVMCYQSDLLLCRTLFEMMLHHIFKLVPCIRNVTEKSPTLMIGNMNIGPIIGLSLLP